MNTQKPTSTTQIPNTETDSAPESFGQGPTEAITTAMRSSATVKLVLNKAQIALAARADLFTRDVGVKAVQIAGERHASAVDVPDVDKAAELLYPNQTRSNNTWAWGLLGIIAGALLSFLVTALAPVIPDGWQPASIVIALLLLLGCCVWAFFLMWPRKTK